MKGYINKDQRFDFDLASSFGFSSAFSGSPAFYSDFNTYAYVFFFFVPELSVYYYFSFYFNSILLIYLL